MNRAWFWSFSLAEEPSWKYFVKNTPDRIYFAHYLYVGRSEEWPNYAMRGTREVMRETPLVKLGQVGALTVVADSPPGRHEGCPTHGMLWP